MFAIQPERQAIWPERLKPIGEGSLDKESFEAWWDRAKRELGHLPQELCEQWVHRHWHYSPFAFLPLDTLRCEEICLKAEEILERVHREYGGNLDPVFDRAQLEKTHFDDMHPTANAFKKLGTWDFPITVLHTPKGFQGFVRGSEAIRYVLVEGHQRHRYLNALMHFREAPEGPHRIFVLHSPMVC